MFWIEGREVNTAELGCISFFFFLLLDLWQHSENNEFKVCTATKRVKNYNSTALKEGLPVTVSFSHCLCVF